MSHPLATVAAAAGVFAGTNVDDLVVLTMLFVLGRGAGASGRAQVWVGQYLGIGALVAAAALGAVGLLVVPDRWVGLLGLIPLGLGVRALVRTVRHRRAEEPPDGGGAAVATTTLTVAATTIANGADNLAVYTPMFRTIGLADSLLTVAVFAVLVAVWCLAGTWLASHRRVVTIILRYGRWLVPAVFIALGALIVIESGIIGHLANRP